MIVQRHRRHHNISVPQHPNPSHRTSNLITLAHAVDVVVFDHQDRLVNSTNHRINYYLVYEIV